MPLFASDDEYRQCAHDASLVAEKADAFIRELYVQLETSKAQADAAAITVEQTCSLLEHKHVSLSSEFAELQSRYSQLNSTLDKRLSELASLQSEKHQLTLQTIEKDGAIERLSMEASEFYKSKRQLIELLEQKDLEIREKNATIKSYLDKIVNLTENAASKEARLSDLESELTHTRASCSRLSEEKELIERHNTWLNDELTSKVNNLIELRKAHNELEADMSSKIADAEKKFGVSSEALKRNQDRVRDLELKLTSLKEELCSAKDAAAASEQSYIAEISTITKLVELYKESSEEWSNKAGELEGVIRAMETHSTQVENDYNAKLDKESSIRKEIETEASNLKEKLKNCEVELEKSRKSLESDPLPLSGFFGGKWHGSTESNDIIEDRGFLVPSIPAGVSGTALAASLLRDGWSLAKMYAKYEEAVDALRHEQLGRKQSQAILERVLYEIEEKAGVILEERAEHEKLVDAYSLVNQKLQHSLSEQTTLQNTIRELKVDLKRHERDYVLAQKEIADLQEQVTVLLKECQDIQVRCGSATIDLADEDLCTSAFALKSNSDVEKVLSERLLAFKDINGLVEQNVQLRSLVRSLSDQIENKEMELKVQFERELQKHTSEAASKVNAVLARSEEQGRMIESLHVSVAMYRKLCEERTAQTSPVQVSEAATEGRKEFMLLFENSQEAIKREKEQALERVKSLEDDASNLRAEIISLRSERDKLALEAKFANEKLDRFVKDFEHQRNELNGIIARNVELSQLIVEYQRRLREKSESMCSAEELSRKLNVEVSILKNEKDLLLNAEKRACDEVRSLSERVYRLQASLDTIQSAEEVREEARSIERKKLEEYTKQIEREWAEAKKDLHEERDNVRVLTLERESVMKNAMRQVEEIGKELANALHAIAAAEARATAAETRVSEMEKNLRPAALKMSENDEYGASTTLDNEVVADLHAAKEQIEKLREEALVNKEHMLQYKGIAQVNEAALKQMECTYGNFRVEAENVRNSLERELQTLRGKVNELETECSLKVKEAESIAAVKEEALSSALSNMACLRDKNAVKMLEASLMEAQIATLMDDLDKEHAKWRSAQGNYERQVVLQSETIQELKKTSEALAVLQDEASDLRKLADSLKSENNELKVNWEAEKSVLEESKNIAEKKYNEMNEQNKILHNRLEALHIKLAEKDRGIIGSGGHIIAEDAGLQSVVNYLRRSKEIAETEISLLKQEKLRLQSQLEGALKAVDLAQASLNAERAKSQSLVFTEEEFKSLQLQAREMNLLRESNMQLREENKYNFEECQKLREANQNARIECEHLEAQLRTREIEVEASKKEIEMQKMDNEVLMKRVAELVESSKNISIEEYDSLKEDVKQMQATLKNKDSILEENAKLISRKEDIILQLDQDLSRCRVELGQRETRTNEVLLVEASLKSDVERQKKLNVQLKKKIDSTLREKEELVKENQTLSKQLEDSRQVKKNAGDSAAEQALKEKEREKDTRIQILEKTLERRTEELRKERDGHRNEKVKRQKMQDTITESLDLVNKERGRLVDELEKHKKALKTIADVGDKYEVVKNSPLEGTSVDELLSGAPLEDLASAYHLAVDSFERTSHSISSELDVSLTAGQKTPVATQDMTLPVISLPSSSFAKVSEGSENIINSTKTNVETRKSGRRLVRPRIAKPDQHQVDHEYAESERLNNLGKSIASSMEAQVTIAMPTEASTRKQLPALSVPELNEESGLRGTESDTLAPLTKGSDSVQEGVEELQGDAEMSQAGVPDSTGKPVGPSIVENQGSLSMPSQIRKRPSAAGTSESQEESGIPGEAGSDTLEPLTKRSRGCDSPLESTERQYAPNTEGLDNLPSSEELLDDVDLAQGTGEELVDNKNVGTEIPEEQIEPNRDVKDQTLLNSDRRDVTGEVLDRQSEFMILDDQFNVESGSEREEGELISEVPDSDSGGNPTNVVPSPEPGEVELQNTPTALSPGAFDDEITVTGTADTGDVSSPLVSDDVKNEDSDMDGSNQQVAAVTDPTPESTLATSESISTTIAAEVGTHRSGASVSGETGEARQSPVTRSSTTINLHERARQRALLRQAGQTGTSTSSASRGRGRGTRSPRGGGRRGRGQASGHGQASGD